MRVLLADDHALFRDGVASLLASRDVEVVGEASDGLEAIAKARELHPDIILMDIKMPRCSGLEATRRIKAELPETKIIMLTVSDDDEDLFEAIKSGTQGYLLKNLEAEDLFQALEGVARGEAAISPVLASRILVEFARQAGKTEDPDVTDELTEREKDVLRLVATGSPNKEIASQLYITENTVKYHLRNIMEKLHLRNRSQMAAYAVSEGIVENSVEEH